MTSDPGSGQVARGPAAGGPVSGGVGRRRALTLGAAAAALPLVHIRGANAAGKLSVGFWDHWVPGANDTTEKLVREWAEAEKVDVQIDFITSQGNKLLLTTAAENQARSGHDVLAFSTWLPAEYARNLEPVNDLMDPLIKANGKVNATVEYLGKVDGKWLAVPATSGSQIKGPCSRIDLLKQHAGIDIQALYPAGGPPKADGWNLDAFMKAAAACNKAGVPFGVGLGVTSDSVDTIGAFFHAHAAMLVDAKGNITAKTDPVRKALTYYRELQEHLPRDVASWDDASNNKWLVSGRGAMVMNPPSAWAVAVRDAPQIAEQLWTHGFPSGPNGRYAPFLPYFWGVWSFSKNKPAAKSLIAHLSQKPAVERMVKASAGYDLSAFADLTTLPVYGEQGPPKGTLYHYPNPHDHQTLSIAAAPAPHKIAVQIYTQGIMTKMAVRHFQGEALEKTLDWASRELEGFMRS